MRQKKIWRYYCDFCRKANCSKSAISKHEERCTNNPNRVCGMCKMLEQAQPSIPDLIALIPPMVVSQEGDCLDWIAWKDDSEAGIALQRIRKATGNCPACILATLRQAKVPVPMMQGFNFSEECKKIWQEVNEEREYDRKERNDYASWAIEQVPDYLKA